MKKYIISFVCLLLVCLLFSLHVAAANTEVGVMPFIITDWSCSPVESYYNGEQIFSEPISYFKKESNSFYFNYMFMGEVDYYCTNLGISGYWLDPDNEFYNIMDFDVAYLNFCYSFYDHYHPSSYVDPILGGQHLDVFISPSPSDGVNTYFDFDYAIEIDNGDGRKQIVYRIPNPSAFFIRSDVVHYAFDVFLQWDALYDYAEPVNGWTIFQNDGISISKELIVDDPDDSETTAPDLGGSGDSGDSGDIPPSNVTVIVNKIDAVGTLLADLKQLSIDQYELQATQNVLISQLPDKLKDMSLGEVTRPNIPSDKLSGLEQKEDELYEKSDQLLGGKNNVIDGDFNNYVKPSTGNTSAAYDLFFERLFDIPWINKMVYISLWFGLGGFVLRLGRKLN